MYVCMYVCMYVFRAVTLEQKQQQKADYVSSCRQKSEVDPTAQHYLFMRDCI